MMHNYEAEYGTTSVRWDMKSCPIPGGYDPRLIGQSIKSALEKSGISGPITVTAIGNLKLIPHNVLQELSSTGIALKHVSCGGLSMLVDLFEWERHNPPPANIMLISSEYFFKTLSSLRSKRYNVFQAYPYPQQFPVDPSVSKQWHWETLIRDAMDSGVSADNKQELQKKRIEPCECAGSCKLCGVVCQSFEDFTMHLCSKEHAQRELETHTIGGPIIVGGPPSVEMTNKALVGAKTLKIKLKKSIISQHQTEALVPVKTEASPPQEATSTKLKLLSAPASTRKIPSHNVTNVVLHNRFDALQMS